MNNKIYKSFSFYKFPLWFCDWCLTGNYRAKSLGCQRCHNNPLKKYNNLKVKENSDDVKEKAIDKNNNEEIKKVKKCIRCQEPLLIYHDRCPRCLYVRKKFSNNFWLGV